MAGGYSKEELEKLNVGQLKRLCNYYGIEINPEWRKARLVKELLKSNNPPKVVTIKGSPSSPTSAPDPFIKSVRIERIENSMKGKQNDN